MALAMASKQEVDWDKVVAAKRLTANVFTTLMKAAKKLSKKVLAVVDPSSVATDSPAPSGAARTKFQ